MPDFQGHQARGQRDVFLHTCGRACAERERAREENDNSQRQNNVYDVYDADWNGMAANSTGLDDTDEDVPVDREMEYVRAVIDRIERRFEKPIPWCMNILKEIHPNGMTPQGLENEILRFYEANIEAELAEECIANGTSCRAMLGIECVE